MFMKKSENTLSAYKSFLSIVIHYDDDKLCAKETLMRRALMFNKYLGHTNNLSSWTT